MLDGPLLLPPLVLATLLATSGVAKLRRPRDARSAFAQLELPRWLRRSPAPTLLPWLEVVLAVALLVTPAPFAIGVAVAALVLFVAYLVVIVRALGFDHPVTCGCFGRLGLGEVTRRTAARNVLLVVFAGLGVWSATGEGSVGGRLVDASWQGWAWVVLTAATGALLGLTFGGRAKGAGAPPPATAGEGGLVEDYRRAPFPYASLVDEHGSTLTLTDLVREGAHLLVFVSTGCTSCADAIARVPEWDRALGPVQVSAVAARDTHAVVADAPGLAGRLLQDPAGTTARIFGIAAPGAVLLGGDGMLAGGPVRGGSEVAEFVDDVRAELVDAGLLGEGSAPVGE